MQYLKKAISKHPDLSEDEIASLLAARILNAKKKNRCSYYNEGVNAMTGTQSEEKLKLEPRLQRVSKTTQ